MFRGRVPNKTTPTEMQATCWGVGRVLRPFTFLIVSTGGSFHIFFIVKQQFLSSIKSSLGYCKCFPRFQSSAKVDLDNFASSLTTFIWISRAPEFPAPTSPFWLTSPSTKMCLCMNVFTECMKECIIFQGTSVNCQGYTKGYTKCTGNKKNLKTWNKKALEAK